MNKVFMPALAAGLLWGLFTTFGTGWQTAAIVAEFVCGLLIAAGAAYLLDLRKNESRWIVISLAVFAIASLLLATGGFITGMMAFMIAQIMFIVLNIARSKVWRPFKRFEMLAYAAIWFTVSMVLGYLVVTYATHTNLALVLYIYAALVSLMVATSRMPLSAEVHPSRFDLAVAGAGCLFVSDLILAVQMFGSLAGSPGVGYFIMMTYWGGLVFYARSGPKLVL